MLWHCGAICVVTTQKRRLVEEQNRILEIRVAERTSELRAKNDDIQAMLSNMRQGLLPLNPAAIFIKNIPCS